MRLLRAVCHQAKLEERRKRREDRKLAEQQGMRGEGSGGAGVAAGGDGKLVKLKVSIFPDGSLKVAIKPLPQQEQPPVDDEIQQQA